jgi:hypothetical protein
MISAPALLARREFTHPSRYLATVGEKSDPGQLAVEALQVLE